MSFTFASFQFSFLFKAYMWKNLKAEEKNQVVQKSKPNVLVKFAKACANVKGKKSRMQNV